MTTLGFNASLAAENAQYGYDNGTRMQAKTPSWRIGERVNIGDTMGLEVIDRCGNEWFLMKQGTDECYTFNVKRGLRRL